ncbi:hypothetical protein BDN72DRAFT_834280 [Pluteus cervinus]|uniref:Uncharacterized protein n=1 Tax=Pluteus cervinus TaxID=181527 RepID=A0ACD3B6Z9_9AGAR|nr:hypothetical protein BDN72DRAFT_834280 [Pluteus cervinus]
MLTSLVIVSPHQGGALVLRHDNEESTFDSASLEPGSTANLITFYRDVEHEVLLVEPGYHALEIPFPQHPKSLPSPSLASDSYSSRSKIN